MIHGSKSVFLPGGEYLNVSLYTWVEEKGSEEEGGGGLYVSYMLTATYQRTDDSPFESMEKIRSENGAYVYPVFEAYCKRIETIAALYNVRTVSTVYAGKE